MPTYVRKDTDGNAVEKISPELGGPEDLRLAAACRGDEPAWAVETEAGPTEQGPAAQDERPEVATAAAAAQGRPPKSPAAAKKADEGSGESSDG